MSALFPRWTNSLVRVTILVLIVMAIGGASLIWIWMRTPYVRTTHEQLEQPIMFDHRHHVIDDGIDCRYCHFEAEKSPYAGVPPTELCMNCHSQIWNDSPHLQKLRESYYSGKPIVWAKVHRLPEFVYFNHSIHVERGIGCVSCHGRVDQMANVEARNPMQMGWCLDCHRAPENHLRPIEHMTDMEWAPESQVRLGMQLKHENNINPPVNCTGCHR